MPEELIADNYLSTRVPASVKESVESMAADERRSVSLMTFILIEEALAARAKKAKKQ